MDVSTAINFLKGHGTGNDFVIINNLDDALAITPDLAAALCDRHFGIGADGLIAIVTLGQIRHSELLTAAQLEALDGLDDDAFVMDYRNADGSIAEMCGNGVRVFAHALAYLGLIQGTTHRIGTRAGIKTVTIDPQPADNYPGHCEVSVDMGPVRVDGSSTCQIGDDEFTGLSVNVGNPHLACVVEGLDGAGLAQLPIQDSPQFSADDFPQGVNIEVLTPIDSDDTCVMRVHERGSGETLSCGTGTVAAVTAALAQAGRDSGSVRVIIPGGEVTVTINPADADAALPTAILAGPSNIVARGEIDPRELKYI